MSSRLRFHAELVSIFGVGRVYYQPPESTRLTYPCAIYSRVPGDVTFANNLQYKNQRKYEVTVIDHDPDSLLADKVELLPLCRFDRRYVANNLYHYTFSVYY